jgi:hypothetical protein
MRQKLIAPLAALLLCTLASSALAEDPVPRFLPPEQVVLYLADKLALSEDQKAAITPIIAERQTKMKAALAERNAGTEQRRHEVMSIFGDSDRKINAVLNPDQQKKYAEIERTMLQQLQQRVQAT